MSKLVDPKVQKILSGKSGEIMEEAIRRALLGDSKIMTKLLDKMLPNLNRNENENKKSFEDFFLRIKSKNKAKHLNAHLKAKSLPEGMKQIASNNLLQEVQRVRSGVDSGSPDSNQLHMEEDEHEVTVSMTHEPGGDDGGGD